MNNIGLIDVDSVLPNYVLAKIAAYHKALGCLVEFVRPDHTYKKIFASAIFTRSRGKCQELLDRYGNLIEIGGSGWDIQKRLPPEIESCPPDYSLYSAELIASRIRVIGTREHKQRKAQTIVDSGMGFSSRGCVRSCPFCLVWQKEGNFCQAQEIGSLVNPRSNVLCLMDNNLTADPYAVDKLAEIRDRKLILDLCQGFDVRLMTEEIAQMIAQVKHLRRIHYAWDLMKYEKQVLAGIEILSRFVKPYRQMCFMLVGYDTSFAEDNYRFRRLRELGVSPFVMVYNQMPDLRLKHFARWVNGRFCEICSFEDYQPWLRVKKEWQRQQVYQERVLWNDYAVC